MDDHTASRTWTDEQLLLTAEEAARALHVGRTTLFALIKNGELHAVHIGRSCRLTRAELLRYVTRLDRPKAPHAGRTMSGRRPVARHRPAQQLAVRAPHHPPGQRRRPGLRGTQDQRSERTLAIPLPLVAALHVHKAAQMGERMLAGSEWQNDDLVFAQASGRPIDKKSDYDDWCRLLERAGVRHVRLHDGRHTAATLLLSEGVHPRVVMELLGHSQMRTTMDIYSHVMPALAREAADRMEAVLLSPLATIGNQTGNQPKIVDLAEGSSP